MVEQEINVPKINSEAITPETLVGKLTTKLDIIYQMSITKKDFERLEKIVSAYEKNIEKARVRRNSKAVIDKLNWILTNMILPDGTKKSINVPRDTTPSVV